MKRLILSLCVFCILPLATSSAQNLDAFKNKYETKATEIQSDAAATDLAGQNYLKALDALVAKYTKDGNFDGVKATMGEKERFTIDGTSLAESDTRLPDLLSKTQDQYQELLKQSEQDKARTLLSLSKRYQYGLNQLMKKLLADKAMDEAGKVDTEIKRLNFIIAALEIEGEGAEAKQEVAVTQPVNPRPTAVSGLILSKGRSIEELFVGKWAWIGKDHVEVNCFYKDGSAEINLPSGKLKLRGTWEAEKDRITVLWDNSAVYVFYAPLDIPEVKVTTAKSAAAHRISSKRNNARFRKVSDSTLR
jgi:hypothetical protein